MDKTPQHVAIIPDGNRRWAKAHAMEIVRGHRAGGMKILEEIIDEAITLHIPYVTFWVFSTENWSRPKPEIDALMGLFRHDFMQSMEKIMARGVRLLFIGDIDKFPKDIAETLKKARDSSAKNTALTVVLAANYGGRAEIAKSVKRMVDPTSPFGIRGASEIKKLIEENLESHVLGIPDPDLIIRTGGEQRLSGYLLWQSEYAELYFTETLMPDFGRVEFKKAVEEYGKRQRRFGK